MNDTLCTREHDFTEGLYVEDWALWYVALSIAAFDRDGYCVERRDFMDEWVAQIEENV